MLWAYVIRRVLATIPVMGVVAVFVFSLLYLSPGRPGRRHRRRSGHDRGRQPHPRAARVERAVSEQFGDWIWNVLHGDLGYSIFANQPVTQMILQRVEPTIALAICSMLIAVAVAVPLGVIAAWKAGTWIDRLVMAFAVFGFSFPTFVIGYLLIFGLSMWANVLPVQGYVSISKGFFAFLPNIIMPSLTLGIVLIALIARMTRASMLEVLEPGLHPHRAIEGPEQHQGPGRSCAQERIDPDRHDDRSRICALDQRRRRDRNGVRHSGNRPADGRCHPAA